MTPMGRAARGAGKDGTAGSSRPPPSRVVDLKGLRTENALGRRLTVLYEEGLEHAVPYEGVVVYVEKTRCASP